MTRVAALLTLLAFARVAVAQVYVAPPRVYVAPPPPVYVAPPPPVYAPRVYVAPAPAPIYVQPAPNPMRYRIISRTLVGVGVPLLALGFFAMVAGIPVTILTHAGKLCDPSPGRDCSGYYSLSYGLLGGGAAAFTTGLVLSIVGRAFWIRSAWASRAMPTPQLALLPAADGSVGGATASLTFRF
jgi:hypothetical protein